MERVTPSALDLLCLEQGDNKKKFTTEFKSFSPLMLACAGESNVECVKILLKYKASVETADEFGNNPIHIAARAKNNKILEYLGKNSNLDIFARNNEGKTALNICKDVKNSEGEKILSELCSEYDQSSKIANDLLNEIENEENKAQEEK